MSVQRDETWLASASPQDIDRAWRAGELADLMAAPPPPAAPVRAPAGQLTAGEVRGMTPDQVAAAVSAGRLDFLLGRTPGEPAPPQGATEGGTDA